MKSASQPVIIRPARTFAIRRLIASLLAIPLLLVALACRMPVGISLTRPATQAVQPGPTPSRPDGVLAFTANLANSDGSPNTEIILIKADGSGLRNLTNSPAQESYPSWSSDGQRLVFTRSESDGSNHAIYVIGADGAGLRPLTSPDAQAVYAFWSPAGGQIAYAVSPQAGGGLWIVAADGSNPRQLSPLTPEPEDLAWAPDGTWLTFAARTGDPTYDPDIFTVRADGSNLRNFSDRPGPESRPTITPDGRQVLCLCGRPQSLCLYDLNGRLVSQVDYPGNPDFRLSPDGKRLVFTASSNQLNSRVALMNFDGSGLSSLAGVPSSHVHFAPTWSPDGRWIVFFSRVGELATLMRMTPQASELEALAQGGAVNPSGPIYWSP